MPDFKPSTNQSQSRLADFTVLLDTPAKPTKLTVLACQFVQKPPNLIEKRLQFDPVYLISQPKLDQTDGRLSSLNSNKNATAT